MPRTDHRHGLAELYAVTIDDLEQESEVTFLKLRRVPINIMAGAVTDRIVQEAKASYLLPPKDEPAGRQGDHYKTGVHDEWSFPPRRCLLEGKGACQFVQAEWSEVTDVGQRGDDASDDESDYPDAGGGD